MKPRMRWRSILIGLMLSLAFWVSLVVGLMWRAETEDKEGARPNSVLG